MNVIVVISVIVITLSVIFWLTGKLCMHRYEIIDKQDQGFGADIKWPTERTYVTRCVKCGKICTKKVRLR
jgi:hypothetical protein